MRRVDLRTASHGLLCLLPWRAVQHGWLRLRPRVEGRPRVDESAYIFHGNTSPDGVKVDGKGRWSRLQPGHGVGFKSNGKQNQYSDRFGVELSFAKEIQRQFPERDRFDQIFEGGTSIAEDAAGNFGCWEPDFDGINQYDHFLATLNTPSLRTILMAMAPKIVDPFRDLVDARKVMLFTPKRLPKDTTAT